MNVNERAFPAMFLLASTILVMLFGCTQLEEYYSKEGLETKHGVIIDEAALEANQCASGDCICFVCKNETPTDTELLNALAAPFFDYTLEEGECKFTPCTETEFADGFESEPDMHPYFFMIGQGSNFAEWADANAYCNNSLRMAVKWLSSREGYDYPLPREDRASCILSLNAIPTYILYSEGKAISPSRASQIAQEFAETGPVLLVSEMDFDPSDNAQFSAAVAQVKSMDAACPKCLVAIAPKFYYNETFGYSPSYEAIDAIFADPEAAASIDIVAVGVNSHHSQHCTSPEMMEDALNYSRYIMETYRKPTLWAYVLFDQDWNAGGEEYGTCKWSESEITKGHSDLFKYSPALVQAGVIGMAPYSLYGIENGPLNCTDCAMMSVDGIRYPSHTTWFSLCQKYYTYRGAMPIVFTPDPGTDCSFGNNFNMYQLEGSRVGTSPTIEELEGKEVEPMEIFPRCNGQLLSELPEDIDSIPTFTIGHNDAKCDIHPMLDIYADIRDMDPALTRAFAWAETGLDSDVQGPGGDTCEISQVTASSSFPNQLTDPDGVCGTQTAASGKSFHSLGVMQVHIYPYDIWSQYSPGSYEDEARWCGGNFFNPLNEAHNACMGTAILGDYLDAAMQKVASNEGKLGLTDLKTQYGESSPEYQNMKGAITIFAASYRYNGYTGYTNNEQAWINEFGNQRVMDEEYCENHKDTLCCDSDGDVISSGCCGQTNFIDFVKNCHMSSGGSGLQISNPGAQYGFRILGMYNALIDDCDKYDEQAWYQNVIDYLQSYYQEAPASVGTVGTLTN